MLDELIHDLSFELFHIVGSWPETIPPALLVHLLQSAMAAFVKLCIYDGKNSKPLLRPLGRGSSFAGQLHHLGLVCLWED